MLQFYNFIETHLLFTLICYVLLAIYYNMIYICLIISAFACQASGKKYIIQTKNENGGTKPVEDRDCNPVEDRDSKPAVEYEGSKPVKKTDLGGSFGSDYMDGGGYYSTVDF